MLPRAALSAQQRFVAAMAGSALTAIVGPYHTRADSQGRERWRRAAGERGRGEGQGRGRGERCRREPSRSERCRRAL